MGGGGSEAIERIRGTGWREQGSQKEGCRMIMEDRLMERASWGCVLMKDKYEMTVMWMEMRATQL